MSAAKFTPLVSLAPEYLAQLTLHSSTVGTSTSAAPTAADAAPSQIREPPTEGGVFRCGVSGVTFESAEELREHYRTDWYRCNLKRSGRGAPPLSEAEFAALAEADALDDELSGSDSEGDDDDGEGGEAEVDRLARQPRLALRDADGGTLLVWRAALSAVADAPAASLLDALRSLAARRPPPVWAVVLCRGGHFAAAAYELQPPPKGSRKADDCVKVLAHRSFHRYVTRRKAGGR